MIASKGKFHSFRNSFLKHFLNLSRQALNNRIFEDSRHFLEFFDKLSLLVQFLLQDLFKYCILR
jgi:hypothetical protein